jgi:hypothetical protein
MLLATFDSIFEKKEGSSFRFRIEIKTNIFEFRNVSEAI